MTEADRRVKRLTLAIADGGKQFDEIREMMTTLVVSVSAIATSWLTSTQNRGLR